MPLTLTLPRFEEDQVLASICKDSFFDFLINFWDTVIAEKLILNWHMEYLCDELQVMAEDVFRGIAKLYDLIINISPGTTKSTICSVMFPAWCWTRMPSCKFICGSYSHHLAMDLSRKCRDVVKSEKYQRCFPFINLREDQDTKEHFVNTLMGVRYAVGVGGSVMGMHGHFILIDDPLDPQEALSDADINTANHWMNEVVSRRKVSLTVTPTILIQQRLHQNDPSGNRLEKADKMPVKKICIPAEVTEEVEPVELEEFYIDDLMDPVRLPRMALEQAHAELGDYGYAGQYLQSPVPRGGGMFHIKMLKIGKPPQKFKTVIRYWDKAGTQGGKGAYTVGLLMGEDFENRYWVLDVKRGRWDSHRRERVIIDTTREDITLYGMGISVCTEQEPGSGGKQSAEDTVARIARELGVLATVHKVGASDGDKEKRADPFSVQVNAGNVWLSEGHWNTEYIQELRYFPMSKYKDQVDASSGAYNQMKKRIVVGGLGAK